MLLSASKDLPMFSTSRSEVQSSDSKYEKGEGDVTLSFVELVDYFLRHLSDICSNELTATLDDVMFFLHMPYLLAHHGYREEKSEQKLMDDFTKSYVAKFINQTTAKVVLSFVKSVNPEDAELLFDTLAWNLTGIQRLRKLVDNNLMSESLMEYLCRNLEWCGQLLERAEPALGLSTPAVSRVCLESRAESSADDFDDKLESNIGSESGASSRHVDDLSVARAICGETQLKSKPETSHIFAPETSLAIKLEDKLNLKDRTNNNVTQPVVPATPNSAFPKPATLACILDAHRQMMIGAESYRGVERLKSSTVKLEKIFHSLINELDSDVDLCGWKLQQLAQAWCYLNHWDGPNGDANLRVYPKSDQLAKLFSAIVRKVKKIDENLDEFLPKVLDDFELSPLRFCVCISRPLFRKQLEQCDAGVSCDQGSYPRGNMRRSDFLPDAKLQTPETLKLINVYMLPLHLKIVSHESYEHNEMDYELSTALLQLVYWEGFVEDGNISNISGVLDVWDSLINDEKMLMKRLYKVAKFMWVVIDRFERQDSLLADNWRLASTVSAKEEKIMTSLMPSVVKLSKTLYQKLQSMEPTEEDRIKTEYWMKRMHLSKFVEKYRERNRNVKL